MDAKMTIYISYLSLYVKLLFLFYDQREYYLKLYMCSIFLSIDPDNKKRFLKASIYLMSIFRNPFRQVMQENVQIKTVYTISTFSAYKKTSMLKFENLYIYVKKYFNVTSSFDSNSIILSQAFTDNWALQNIALPHIQRISHGVISLYIHYFPYYPIPQ